MELYLYSQINVNVWLRKQKVMTVLNVSGIPLVIVINLRNGSV
jgi:hypothetical protein